jgi:glutamine---fructose-6-phosphate transaminase (isomerizing)
VSRFREEIGEQPEVAARLLRSASEPVAAIADRLRAQRPAGFLVAARGSSDHAALFGQYLFGSRNRALVSLATPSLFTRYGSPPRLEGWCVVGVSQSGASPDVVAVIEEARRQGCVTVAITNQAGSRLAAAAELVLDLDAGPERSVPASKTYIASLLGLAMISQALDPDPAFGRALEAVPAALETALGKDADLERLVPTLLGPRAVVLGRGYNLATAEEVALKLTETSYVLARAWSVADFEHGPIAVLEPGFPTLLVGAAGPVAGDLVEIAERLAECGSRVIGLFDGTPGPLPAEATVKVDSGLPEELTPLTLAVLGQLLAHRVAAALKVDPDRPRALHKVTRTW